MTDLTFRFVQWEVGMPHVVKTVEREGEVRIECVRKPDLLGEAQTCRIEAKDNHNTVTVIVLTDRQNDAWFGEECHSLLTIEACRVLNYKICRKKNLEQE